MTEEVTKTDEVPEWASVEDMIDYFNHGITAAMLHLARIMWEAGAAGLELQNSSDYGDNAIERFAAGIHRGKTWVYECIKMHETYTWEYIQDKFLKAGIPATSIARLGSITDEGARNYVEDKLIKGEITYEEIAKAKKEYQEVVNNPDADGTAAYELGEQSVTETNKVEDLGPDDPSTVSNEKIRRRCSKVGSALDKLEEELEEFYNDFRNEIDNISDQSLYEVAEERFCDAVEKLCTLQPYLDNLEDSAHKMRPERFPVD